MRANEKHITFITIVTFLLHLYYGFLHILITSFLFSSSFSFYRKYLISFDQCCYRFDMIALAVFFTCSGNPQSIDAATELGLLYLRIGDMQRAFQQFGAALAHSPNCVKAILPMAYVMQVRKFMEMTYYYFDNLSLICKGT